jgi:hypothetical protein
VAPHDLEKLDDALRCMDLQRQPSFTGGRGAVAQQRCGARIDLRRIAVEPAERCWRGRSITLSARSSPSSPACSSQV